MKYVDLTPRWEEILPTWLMMFEQAARGDCSNPDLVKGNAREELRRMAQAADRYGDLISYLCSNQKWIDGEFKEALRIGRNICELDRNTKKESIDG